MRGILLSLVFASVAACGSHTNNAPPPMSPTNPPATGDNTPPPSDPPPSSGGQGWWCFKSTSAKDGSSLTSCERTQQECQTDVDEQRKDPDQSGDQWTECAAQASAYCFSFVPHDGNNDISMCEGTFSECDQFRSHLDNASNANPDQWARPGSVSMCSEIQ
ncbi:MAG TPA: hypothetical protein VL463_33800 [Kofleriaceae bacterium]|nr:hypothetical protein [Kofleriaceae bacterium]